MPDPKRGVAFTFDLGLIDQASRPQFKANPTLATGDVKVSIDGGAFANLATLPVVEPASGRNVKVSLSAAEMTGDRVVVQFVDAAGAEWDEALVTILPTIQTVDDLPTQTTVWNKAMSELAAVPAVTGTVLQALQWLFLLARNKITQTSTVQTLRNDADDASVATAAVSDDGATFTRSEWQ